MTFPRHVCDDDDIQFLALGLCVCGGGADAAGKHNMTKTEQLVEIVIKEEMIIVETFIIIIKDD